MSSIRVLYAEDNRDDADLTRSHFAEYAPDIAIEVVDSGRRALARLAAGGFQALMLDHHLPDMDAADVLKELAVRGIALPTIVVTGVGDEELVVQLLRLGAWDYVPKRAGYIETLPTVLRHAVQEFDARARVGRTMLPRQRRVLYVEPHGSDVDLTIRHFAASAPHLSIDVVESSEEALAKLAAGGVDVVVTDLRLSDMNALDLMREARHRGLHVPFIVITGRGDETAAIAALKLGAYDYIIKRDNYLTQLPYAIDNAADRFELARANQRLQAELAERERAESALRHQADAMSESARQKDEFLAMLGHELRNPLAPVRTALELMRRNDPQSVVERRAYEVMDRQIAHMVRIVDDLLDVSRITTGRIKLNVKEVDLRQVAGDAVDSVRLLMDSRRLRLDVSLSPHHVPVRGDPTRLVQVLVNLLNNAAKYTPEGGSVRLVLEQDTAHAVIRVVDSGVGISARLLPRIFDLFTQEERTLDRAQGGLGLGLSLVRRITELHGGHVQAHSEGRGMGSEFVVRLPLQAAAAVVSAPADAQSAAPHRGPMRCLVVEDNVDAAHMLEFALDSEGHEARLAFDGQAAVEAARQFQPDAVVLDVGLPGMNGYEVARAIRELPGLAEVNIIGATGYGQDSDRRRAEEAGFDHYLVKPIELDALLSALNTGREGHEPPPAIGGLHHRPRHSDS